MDWSRGVIRWDLSCYKDAIWRTDYRDKAGVRETSKEDIMVILVETMMVWGGQEDGKKWVASWEGWAGLTLMLNALWSLSFFQKLCSPLQHLFLHSFLLFYVYILFIYVYYYILIIYLLSMLSRMGILVPWPGMASVPPAVEESEVKVLVAQSCDSLWPQGL